MRRGAIGGEYPALGGGLNRSDGGIRELETLGERRQSDTLQNRGCVGRVTRPSLVGVFLTRELAVRTIGCSTRSCCGILHRLELRENRLRERHLPDRTARQSVVTQRSLRRGARSCSPRSGQDGAKSIAAASTTATPISQATHATSSRCRPGRDVGHRVREEVDDFAIVGEVSHRRGRDRRPRRRRRLRRGPRSPPETGCPGRLKPSDACPRPQVTIPRSASDKTSLSS